MVIKLFCTTVSETQLGSFMEDEVKSGGRRSGKRTNVDTPQLRILKKPVKSHMIKRT